MSDTKTLSKQKQKKYVENEKKRFANYEEKTEELSYSEFTIDLC